MYDKLSFKQLYMLVTVDTINLLATNPIDIKMLLKIGSL